MTRVTTLGTCVSDTVIITLRGACAIGSVVVVIIDVHTKSPDLDT